MKRRNFLSAASAQALALSAAPAVWAMGENQAGEDYPVHSSHETVITKLAGMSLAELRRFHIDEIENEYLPMWDDRRVDHKYGGVRPFGTAMQIGGVDHEGAHLFETDPGGAFRQIYAGALGLGREKADDLLLEKYKENLKFKDAMELGLRALFETLDGEAPPSLEVCNIDHEDGFKLVPQKDLETFVTKAGGSSKKKK